jgi:hypothetical protein
MGVLRGVRGSVGGWVEVERLSRRDFYTRAGSGVVMRDLCLRLESMDLKVDE